MAFGPKQSISWAYSPGHSFTLVYFAFILLWKSWVIAAKSKIPLSGPSPKKKKRFAKPFCKFQFLTCSWLESESESRSVMSDSLQSHGLYSPWNSPGQNTGVGSLSLLQGIFPTQGSNSGLPHCGQILNQLSHEGSPRILEWVAYPFSSGSFQPRNRTGVSCIAGIFFTNWATGEAHSWLQVEIRLSSAEWGFVFIFKN